MAKLTYLLLFLLFVQLSTTNESPPRKRKGNQNPCFKYACRRGEHCQVGPVYCLEPPCREPRPICVPNNRIIRAKDPCEEMMCTKCKFCAVVDGVAQCVPVPPAKNRPDNPFDPCP